MQNEDTIRWPTKAGYGTASIGLGAVELMLQVYLLELYILAGLKPSLAGLAIAVAVFWDAISDPLMGIISDKTSSDSLLGRRVPYLLMGAVLLGVGFSFLFSPETGASQTVLFNQLLIWYLVVNTAMTLYSVPYLALINDVSAGEKERASFFGWRIVLGSIGLLVGIGLPAHFSPGNPQPSIEELLSSRATTGIALGIIAGVGCIFSAITILKFLRGHTDRRKSIPSAPYNTGAIFKQALGSPLFRYLAFGFVAIAIGRSFNSSLALPYYRSTLKFTEEQFGLTILMLTIFIIASAPIWVRLANRFAKTTLFLSTVAALAIISSIAYPSIPPKAISWVILVASIGGILVSSIVLLDSLFSDFVESEKESQSRDVSGAYYGIWRMLSKVARALGIACSGLLLSAIGYEEGSLSQDYSTERAIAWAFGPGVAIFLAAGAFLISRTRQNRNSESQHVSNA
ncbi:MAG TPA: hypothetical protein DIV79_15275 [Opitutae bacterium]|nr:hypothetical protein [Opitutaceae bacterium]HCR31366.1 hypothetical protein [Opitutae bacterium]